ncbi:MAG: SET domain-containing protein [Saprospiraceae bacterium]|nr:SET domain-containing protein [Saprospiraceae bacterium]
MLHPKTELRFINSVVGYGVFATDFIPKGTITYVKDSLELEVSPTEYLLHPPAMQEVIEKYSYIDERGYRIISWDFAKYINHCCNCNSMSTGYGFEIAICDIQAGEEITDEYGIFNLTEPMELVCNKGVCRKVLRPEDFDSLYPVWDEKLKNALANFESVAQPLSKFLDEPTLKALNAYFNDPSQYRSVYTLKYHKQSNGVAVESLKV